MHVGIVEGQPRPFLKTALSGVKCPLRGAQRDFAKVILVDCWLFMVVWLDDFDAGDVEGPCFALNGDEKSGGVGAAKASAMEDDDEDEDYEDGDEEEEDDDEEEDSN
ncbi:hypothetical protein LR48_Vigan05g080900 [Vigna angularis]|uniref:Uncharacterized protein n=1 Tax=Phaseolus angularis TaxID=3914 RepID=A0A0L9UJZ5_PHAAN|nr:hypothetical protein LR48_Vigan05g080900 [Vigna angularis]